MWISEILSDCVLAAGFWVNSANLAGLLEDWAKAPAGRLQLCGS